MALEPGGQKYDFARHHGIKVVAMSWLWDSVKKGGVLDHGEYTIGPPGTGVTVRPEAADALSIVESASAHKPCGPDDRFLDGARVHLCGQSGQRLQKLVRLLRDAGGTKYGHMDASTTHVLFWGSDLAPKDRAAYEQLSHRPLLVSDGWLLACGVEGGLVDSAPYRPAHEVPFTGTSVLAGSQRSQRSVSSAPPPAVDFSAMFADDWAGAHEPAGDGASSTGGAKAPPPEPEGTLFAGLRFVVQMDSGQGRVETFVKDRGGKLSKGDDGADGAHLVVRELLYEGAKAPDGAGSAVEVTAYWLMQCEEDDRLCDPALHSLLQPLRVPKGCDPSSVLCKFHVCVSGFDEPLSHTLIRLIMRLGGKATKDFSRNQATLLVCRVAGSEKHATARKWGIPSASDEWVYASARAGRALDAEDFPCPDAGTAGPAHITAQELLRRLAQRKVSPPAPLPLQGTTIVLSVRLAAQRGDLAALARQLGAAVVTGDRPPTAGCTHFVCPPVKPPNRPDKELRQAQNLEGCAIVSPVWLQRARELGARPTEASYPLMFDPKRSLSLASGATARKETVRQSSRTARSSVDTDQGDSSVGTRGGGSALAPPKRCSPVETEAMRTPPAAAFAMRSDGATSASPLPVATVGADGSDTSHRGSAGDRSGVVDIIDKYISLRPQSSGRQPRRSKRGSTASLDWEGDASDLGGLFGSPIGQSTGVGGAEEETQSPLTASFAIEPDPEEEESQIKVGYEDPGKVEREMLARLCAGAGTAGGQYRFMLSSIKPTEKRKRYARIITSLGGEVIESISFVPSCTHVAVGMPCRNEKYLAACASGKWVLRPSYFDESERMGYFVGEEAHEWNRDAPELEGSCGDELRHADAPRRLRQELKRTGCPVFSQWRVLLCVSKKEVKDGLTRVIEAGGGVVVQRDPPYQSDLPVTHLFFESKAVRVEEAEVDISGWTRRGALCLIKDYIAECLIVGEPKPDEVDRFKFNPRKQQAEAHSAARDPKRSRMHSP